jgi:hypothetical protein
MNDQNTPNQDNELPDVRVIKSEYTPTPWYRETWVYVLTFILLTPVWLILILTDSGISTKNKWIAVIAFAAMMACNLWILPNLF